MDARTLMLIDLPVRLSCFYGVYTWCRPISSVPLGPRCAGSSAWHSNQAARFPAGLSTTSILQSTAETELMISSFAAAGIKPTYGHRSPYSAMNDKYQ